MFCFSSHFPAVVMTADSLSRCQFWKWLFVSSCSQMADESLWRVKFFFPSKMSVNKTGAELQWHLMCYSQETLKCGSRNNTWNLQLLPSVTFICCYERFPSKCILEYNKKKKNPLQLLNQINQTLCFKNLCSLKVLLLWFSLWSWITNQSREHPIQILLYSIRAKKEKT